MSERIQKLLSGLGYGSRREIEEWVTEGRLTVNGATATVGQKISEVDAVKLDGKRISLKAGNEPLRVLLYKKRTGEMVTREDPEGRRTVFRKLPELETGRWIAVGRLDVNTSGLLLLTNHGELARRLMHPSFEQQREYAVRALGEVGDEVFAKLRKGVNLEDGEAHFNSIRFGDNEADLDTSDEDGEEAPQGRANHWFVVTISEGRHREVRRLFESQGLTVNRLIRTGYGPIKLGRGIKSGSYREATHEEITKLLQAVDLPNSERLPERVRESHQAQSEFSRSGPKALPNPRKAAGKEEGWVRANKQERLEVERQERRSERYPKRDEGRAAEGEKPKARRSFSPSSGPRKPFTPAGERPYVKKAEADGSAWKKAPARSSEGGDEGEQFKARGFGAASTRNYSERGDSTPPRRPRFVEGGGGERGRGGRDFERSGERPQRGGPGGGSPWKNSSDKPRFHDASERSGSDDKPQFRARKSFGEGAPRFGREGAGDAPAWKKAAPRREEGARPAFEKKPFARGGDDKPRFRDRKPEGGKPAFRSDRDGGKPSFRAEREGGGSGYRGKPAAGARPAPRKPAGQKFVVRDGQAVNTSRPKLGFKKKKPGADE